MSMDEHALLADPALLLILNSLRRGPWVERYRPGSLGHLGSERGRAYTTAQTVRLKGYDLARTHRRVLVAAGILACRLTDEGVEWRLTDAGVAALLARVDRVAT